MYYFKDSVRTAYIKNSTFSATTKEYQFIHNQSKLVKTYESEIAA